MAEVLKGANTTAQNYEDTFLGSLFGFLEKFLLHTTETLGWPGYGGGASAPNATYHPRLRQIRQHFSNNRSARALRDPSGTAVRENRDRVFQLEIVCYSDKRLGDSVGGLWVGDLTDSHFTDIAWMCIQLAQDLDLPLRQSVGWKEGATSFYSGVRLSGPSYDAYRGILGHIHASGNTHWDPGGFFISRLMAKIAQLLQGDEDMELSDNLTLSGSTKVLIDADTSSVDNALENGLIAGVLVKQNILHLRSELAALTDAVAALSAKIDALPQSPVAIAESLDIVAKET